VFHVFFGRGMPRGAIAAELLVTYRTAKAAMGGGSQVQFPPIWEVDNLLAQPATK
jgi:hypothetical protein